MSSVRFASLVVLISLAALAPAGATDIMMKDGRILSGRLALVASVAELPKAGAEPEPLVIVMLDDDLRRTFVSKRQVREVRKDDNSEVKEKFLIRQSGVRGGPVVKIVGPYLRIEPFDEWGRRIYSMNTTQGKVDIVQAITELTPEWTKVEGLSHSWDMRMATSSIPREILTKILEKQINPKDVEQRKKIARFYIQSERYDDARKELETILAASPANATVREQLAPSIRTLHQLAAQRNLAELRLRREAGQYALAARYLENFPSEGVSGEVLQAVREMLESVKAQAGQRQTALSKLQALAGEISDRQLAEQVKTVRAEIAAELGPNTVGRMTAFLQNADDKDMPAGERLALGLSGWILGSDAATTSLPLALSAYRVREAIRAYINEPVLPNRARHQARLISEEAAGLKTVVTILANMKPPGELPEANPERPGYYALEVPGLPREGPVRYLVQLPPEYDPRRLYPTVVSLHGFGISLEQQLEWWVGPWQGKERSGQATRHGYIVIVPDWCAEHQREYKFSAREHAGVLNCLRDACRRFAIDTDRVYLSGHSIGGDAAWDLGLAHPDLWAGVIPIVARMDRFITFYWENAERVPFYFVGGELDGSRMPVNSRDFDRYLRRGYPTTVVEYLGRGHEDFYDEVLRLFDWMGRLRRDFFPREFNCSTMRPWDNFFWWIEVSGMPAASMVDPANWTGARSGPPQQVRGWITANNGVNVRTGATQVTVWLAPQMVDLGRRVNVMVNGRRLSSQDRSYEPNIGALLEDVRTRGDRQHPFWAKVQMTTGRLSN